MEYIYSAMVLYSAGKSITEDGVKAMLKAAGAPSAAVAATAAPAAAPNPAHEEELVSEEDAAAGLSALFG
jgi:large subunit ribosomal protein L12